MINYYLLTKPGIIFGNLITMAAGFLLASRGEMHYGLFFATLVGLSCIIAAACVFNNYIDRTLDQKMERTKKRALVTGAISVTRALSFAFILSILGNLILMQFTNLLAVVIANFGLFVYVVIYSIWKRHTVYGTAIGSIAGAIPPVVGYCAVSNQFDSGAFIFFMMLTLWQMPHFFAIALMHLKDYTAAGIPVLPVVKGVWRTKVHMVLYIITFIFVAASLTHYQYTGLRYLIATLFMGILWLILGLRGFSATNEQKWGKQMFQCSLLVILGLCSVIAFDVL